MLIGLEGGPKELYRPNTSVVHEQVTQVVRFFKKLFYSELRRFEGFICLENVYGTFWKQPFRKENLSHSGDRRKGCYFPDRNQPKKIFPSLLYNKSLQTKYFLSSMVLFKGI